MDKPMLCEINSNEIKDAWLESANTSRVISVLKTKVAIINRNKFIVHICNAVLHRLVPLTKAS